MSFVMQFPLCWPPLPSHCRLWDSSCTVVLFSFSGVGSISFYDYKSKKYLFLKKIVIVSKMPKRKGNVKEKRKKEIGKGSFLVRLTSWRPVWCFWCVTCHIWPLLPSCLDYCGWECSVSPHSNPLLFPKARSSSCLSSVPLINLQWHLVVCWIKFVPTDGTPHQINLYFPWCSTAPGCVGEELNEKVTVVNRHLLRFEVFQHSNFHCFLSREQNPKVMIF